MLIINKAKILKTGSEIAETSAPMASKDGDPNAVAKKVTKDDHFTPVAALTNLSRG